MPSVKQAREEIKKCPRLKFPKFLLSLLKFLKKRRFTLLQKYNKWKIECAGLCDWALLNQSRLCVISLIGPLKRIQKILDLIAKWNDKGPKTKKRNGMSLFIDNFLKKNDIGIHTFYKYAHIDKSKRQKVGESAGLKRVFSNDNSDFLCSMMIHTGSGKQGLTRRQVISNMMELQLEIHFAQAKNIYHHTFKKRHMGGVRGLLWAWMVCFLWTTATLFFSSTIVCL